MIGKSITAFALAGALAGSLALVGAGTASASRLDARTGTAVQPHTVSPKGAWECSVPPGMTWDWVTYDANCGVADGISYDVIAPAEGVWACMAPAGWNWTATEVSTLCSTNPGFPTTAYRLTKA